MKFCKVGDRFVPRANIIEVQNLSHGGAIRANVTLYVTGVDGLHVERVTLDGSEALELLDWCYRNAGMKP